MGVMECDLALLLKAPVFLASYEIEAEGADWTVVPLFAK